MEIIDGKSKKRTHFVFLYIITVALIALAFVAFLVPTATKEKPDEARRNNSHDNLIVLYDVLNEKWLNFINVKEENSSASSIETAENDFKRSLDSVQISATKNVLNEEKQRFEHAIFSFRKALEISKKSKNSNTGEINNSFEDTALKTGDNRTVDITSLKQQLEEADGKVQTRDRRIKELEGQIIVGTKTGGSKAPDKNNSKVEQENEFLKWAIRSQVTDLKKLTDENNSLKQTNSKLTTQLSEVKKNN